MDFFSQEPPKMNFEGKNSIKTPSGICCSTLLIVYFCIIFGRHLTSMYGGEKYIDLDEYTHEEQDRGFSE